MKLSIECNNYNDIYINVTSTFFCLHTDERQDVKLYDVMTTPITEANKQYLGGAFASLKSTSSTVVIVGDDSCKDQVEVTDVFSVCC